MTRPLLATVLIFSIGCSSKSVTPHTTTEELERLLTRTRAELAEANHRNAELAKQLKASELRAKKEHEAGVDSRAVNGEASYREVFAKQGLDQFMTNVATTHWAEQGLKDSVGAWKNCRANVRFAICQVAAKDYANGDGKLERRLEDDFDQLLHVTAYDSAISSEKLDAMKVSDCIAKYMNWREKRGKE